MAKTKGTAGERAELYRSITEEAERRNINNKSVCKERGVSYNAFYAFSPGNTGRTTTGSR